MEQQVDRKARADRILDTAKDLLLRWGYRRVTIDEIAKRADVGKGTIYLHWRTRDELFLSVSAREAGEMTDAIVKAMRADPTEVALHRYLRRLFVEAMHRPVLRAIFTRDADTLDKFISNPVREPVENAKLVASREYLGVLVDNGLLRTDLRPEDMDYCLTTIVFGFFAVEPVLPANLDLELGQKADLLAETARRTLGPATAPAKKRLIAVAPKVIGIFEQLAHDFHNAAYGGTDE